MPDLRRNLFLQSLSLEEINRVMLLLGDRLDELEGRRGIPTFYTAPDLQGNKITNVLQGETSTEVLTANLEPTDLELSASRLRVKVAEEQALQRTTTGIGLRADTTYGLEIDATAGLRTKVVTAGGVAIDDTDGLYADDANIDHGSLGGLTDDDHVAYLNTARHDLAARHLDAVICQVQWTDYGATSTVVGWSAFTEKQIYYKKIGKTVFVIFAFNGTSDSVNVTFTVPYTSAANPTYNNFICRAQDNTALLLDPAMAELPGSSSTVTVYKNCQGAAWTAANDKLIRGQFFYEASS